MFVEKDLVLPAAHAQLEFSRQRDMVAVCVAYCVSYRQSLACCSSSAPLGLQRKGMLCDHQFLVGGLDQEQDPTVRLRDDPLARRIVRRIQDDAEPCKLLRDASADHWRVLANAGREHERIEPTQG